MKEYYLAIIKFPLFVSLSLVVLVAAFFGIALGSWYKLGLSLFETVLYTGIFIILVLLVSSWILNLMSTHTKIKPRWMAKYAKWMLFHVFFYLAKALGKITFQKDIRSAGKLPQFLTMRSCSPKRLTCLTKISCCSCPIACNARIAMCA
ncbi:MAG: dolichyl-diphosphooligosaccharide--protein glycosyltransferase subunit 2 [Candidatus Cloacimonetes bacterium]|nr:dolichyl-diphosphooligosaccharide--protein glycosyltransferase subunit 2 [Candidatus Cloacimonadota bacterium]